MKLGLAAAVLMLSASSFLFGQDSKMNTPSTASGNKPAVGVASTTQSPTSRVPGFVSGSRDVTQIAFFIVIGVITILTYKKAKLTLLQPLRTEVFKQQLEVFGVVLGAVRHHEFDLRNKFGFRELMEVNTVAMYDSYAYQFFDLNIPEEESPYNSAKCPQLRIFAEAGGTYPSSYPSLRLDDGHLKSEEQPTRDVPDPNTRAALWARYKYNAIRLPKQFVEKEAELTRIADSPLITQELARLISDLEKTVDANVALVSTVLTEAAKEMPEKYPNVETLKKSSFGWILAKYNKGFTPLEPKSEAIADYMRKYFKVEELMR
jgi:hypothetical protein